MVFGKPGKNLGLAYNSQTKLLTFEFWTENKFYQNINTNFLIQRYYFVHIEIKMVVSCIRILFSLLFVVLVPSAK